MRDQALGFGLQSLRIRVQGAGVNDSDLSRNLEPRQAEGLELLGYGCHQRPLLRFPTDRVPAFFRLRHDDDARGLVRLAEDTAGADARDLLEVGGLGCRVWGLGCTQDIAGGRRGGPA